MIATSRLELSDLSRQKRFTTTLEDDLTPQHTVGQVVEHYLARVRIPHNGLPWTAFSRGVRLDHKNRLEDLPDVDSAWMVMPEVSAGAR